MKPFKIWGGFAISWESLRHQATVKSFKRVSSHSTWGQKQRFKLTAKINLK